MPRPGIADDHHPPVGWDDGRRVRNYAAADTQEGEAGEPGCAVGSGGRGEQMVISAEEYAELEQLRTKMEAMKAAFGS